MSTEIKKKPKAYSLFPWRLYWRYVYRQTFLFLIWISFVFFIAGLYFSSGHELLAGSPAVFFVKLFIFIFFVVFLFFIYTGLRYVRPLGRLIFRARRMTLGKSLKSAYLDEELTVEEDQEWSELDCALRDLGKEIRKKSKNLSRERHEIEAILGAVNGAVVAVDRDGIILFYNSKFAYYFGNSEWKGKILRLDEVFRVPEILSVFSDAYKNEKETEIEVRLQAGAPLKEIEFDLSVAPIKRKKINEIKPTDGAIGIFYEISAQKKIEKMRVDFVSNVSHELRTPLTSIKGFTEALQKDIQLKDYHLCEHYAKKISDNSERLLLLVNDLLDLSSIESGVELEKNIFSVKTLTLRVLGQLEDKTKEKKINIHCIYKVEKLCADERRVEQVLRNLIENAIKYIAPEGRVEIIWEEGELVGSVLLRVIDNGPGIEEKHMDRLFERFYRVDKGRSRASGGTGLGLAIVKHILMVHGGKVFVKSERGKGAEFICLFPQNL